MAFPGNATPVAVKGVYFPPDRPHSGPGFRSETSIRTDRQPEYLIHFYPALRLIRIERRKRGDGGWETTHVGWIPESQIEWMELLE